jgi:hypothetical protein
MAPDSTFPLNKGPLGGNEYVLLLEVAADQAVSRIAQTFLTRCKDSTEA